MNNLDELKSLQPDAVAAVLRKVTEGTLRKIIQWMDEQAEEVVTRIKPIMDRELRKREIEYYESKNGGEWI